MKTILVILLFACPLLTTNYTVGSGKTYATTAAGAAVAAAGDTCTIYVGSYAGIYGYEDNGVVDWTNATLPLRRYCPKNVLVSKWLKFSNGVVQCAANV